MRLLQQFTLTLPKSEVLTSNGGRGHHQAHGKAVKNIIEKARPLVRRLEPMESAFIIVQVFKGHARAYDAANLHETVKPIVDAVVRAGKIADDDNSRVLGPLPVHGGVNRSLSKRANPYLGERIQFRVMFFEDGEIRSQLENMLG